LGISGLLFPNRITSQLIKGFEPLDEKKWKIKDEVPVNNTNENLEKKIKQRALNYGIKCMTEVCILCKNKKIQLYFILPPTYHINGSAYNVEEFSNQILPVLKRFDAKLIDHTKLELCREKELFFDTHHLNKNGAARYTAILSAIALTEL
ncbi:MAG TPA: hypothetical protein VLB84_18590, partial [Bacteroidia bacterium]|nr:hypothetical protein [Bacteroidia bacterium]